MLDLKEKMLFQDASYVIWLFFQERNARVERPYKIPLRKKGEYERGNEEPTE